MKHQENYQKTKKHGSHEVEKEIVSFFK